ncbi:hypothetical protein GUI12_03765 [Anaplasmataceae bacterium AB001_6]|nr:hypothetical protein GUI12_03765 [Anaplasmataceae bacterium AB001_6]
MQKEYLHGNYIDKVDLNLIKEKKVDKEEILKRIGPPTVVVDGDFFYIGITAYNAHLKLTRKYDSRTVRLSFDKKGNIKTVKYYNSKMSDIRKINSEKTFFINNLKKSGVFADELSYVDLKLG